MLIVPNHQKSKMEKLFSRQTSLIMELLLITSAKRISSWMECQEGKDWIFLKKYES